MNPLSLFTGPYALLAKWAVIAILAAALFAYGWVKGNDHGTAKLVAYVGKQAVQTEKVRTAREKIVTKIEVKYRERTKEVYIKGDTIEKEVPIYVTKADDSRCTVPVGFMRSYDSALTGTPLTGTASNADRTDSRVPLSVVAATDAHNWKVCHLWKTRAQGWAEFYDGIRKVAP